VFSTERLAAGGYTLLCILVGLALGSCAHPEGHKDLLAFLQDGATTKDEVHMRMGPASVWGGGRIWTYRVGEATEGFYLSEKKSGWLDARYSLVLDFDTDGILRRHAIIDVDARP
jgi:hypothetical protein